MALRSKVNITRTLSTAISSKQSPLSSTKWRWCLAIVLIVFFCWPTHIIVKTQAIAKAATFTDIAAETPGTIAEVFVKTGQWVKKGEPLVRLHNSQLEADLKEAEASEKLARFYSAKYAESSNAQEEALTPQANLNLKAAWAHLNEMRIAYDRLTLRANADGQVLTPHLYGMIGAFVKPGMGVIQIADTHNLVLLIPLTEDEAAILKRGSPVEATWVATAQTFESTISEIPQRKATLKEYQQAFYAQYGGPAPYQQFTSNDEGVIASQLYPIFLAEAPVPGENTFYQENMRATVVIVGERTLMGLRLLRSFRLLIGW